MTTTRNSPDAALLHELALAHLIIRNALAIMTFEQKADWARRNEHDGCEGEGTTRAGERARVIDQAQAAAGRPAKTQEKS